MRRTFGLEHSTVCRGSLTTRLRTSRGLPKRLLMTSVDARCAPSMRKPARLRELGDHGRWTAQGLGDVKRVLHPQSPPAIVRGLPSWQRLPDNGEVGNPSGVVRAMTRQRPFAGRGTLAARQHGEPAAGEIYTATPPMLVVDERTKLGLVYVRPATASGLLWRASLAGVEKYSVRWWRSMRQPAKFGWSFQTVHHDSGTTMSARSRFSSICPA